MSTKVGAHNIEAFLPGDTELTWLLTQCSRSCDRIFLTLTKKHLEVVGQDADEGFMLGLTLSGVIIPKRSPPFCIRVDAREFHAAISCLSGSNGLRLKFFLDRLEICSPGDEATVFNVRAIPAKPILATKVRAHHRLVLPTSSVLLLTKASRVFPDIIRVSFSTRALQIFEAPPSRRMVLSVNVNGAKGHRIEASVASRQLRRISEILKRSTARDATISLDKETPVRLAFRFSKLSSVLASFPREHQNSSEEPEVTSAQSLPVFRTCPIVQLISFIGTRASGTDPLLISRAGLDTRESLNLIQAQKLRLVSWTNNVVALTHEGRHFLSLLRSETASAKIFLHQMAWHKDALYRRMLDVLTSSQTPFDELKSALDNLPSTKQDMGERISVLIGIASWCGVVTRKLGLVYSLKAQSASNAKRSEILA